MEVVSLDAGGLRTLLRGARQQKSSVGAGLSLLFAFNAGHIAGSVNALQHHCASAGQGRHGSEHIVPNAELRGRLLAGAYHAGVAGRAQRCGDRQPSDGTLAAGTPAARVAARRAARKSLLKGTLGDAQERASRPPPPSLGTPVLSCGVAAPPESLDA